MNGYKKGNYLSRVMVANKTEERLHAVHSGSWNLEKRQLFQLLEWSALLTSNTYSIAFCLPLRPPNAAPVRVSQRCDRAGRPVLALIPGCTTVSTNPKQNRKPRSCVGMVNIEFARLLSIGALQLQTQHVQDQAESNNASSSSSVMYL